MSDKKDKNMIDIVEHPESTPARIVIIRKKLLPDNTIIEDKQLEVQGETLRETEKTFNRLKKELR